MLQVAERDEAVATRTPCLGLKNDLCGRDVRMAMGTSMSGNGSSGEGWLKGAFACSLYMLDEIFGQREQERNCFVITNLCMSHWSNICLEKCVQVLREEAGEDGMARCSRCVIIICT